MFLKINFDFLQNIFDLHDLSSPLAGIEGWNFAKFSIFHPPTLFALRFCYQQKHAQSGREHLANSNHFY